MNQQFKMSILEMTILLIAKNEDVSIYDITQKIYDVLSIKEGISYPTVRMLKNEGLLEIYEKNDIKQFYRLTENGIIQLKKYLNDYLHITNKINLLMKGFDFNE